MFIQLNPSSQKAFVSASRASQQLQATFEFVRVRIDRVHLRMR